MQILADRAIFIRVPQKYSNPIIYISHSNPGPLIAKPESNSYIRVYGTYSPIVYKCVSSAACRGSNRGQLPVSTVATVQDRSVMGP
jgi:hypothetical protein